MFTAARFAIAGFLTALCCGLLPGAVQTPATFDGVLPCADCAGVRLTLTLARDGMFFLRRTYLKGDANPQSFYEIGTWREQGSRLTLQGGPDGPQHFETTNDSIRALDRRGQRIESGANHVLEKLNFVVALDATMRLRGTYTNGQLRECVTSRVFRIASGSGMAELDKRTASLRRPALVTLLAHFSSGQLVVDAPVDVRPGEDCGGVGTGGASPTTSVQGTWTLIEVQGTPVNTPPGARAPILNISGDQATGFAGCNQFGGKYTLSGANLQFRDLISTQMACAGPSMQTERRFLDALGRSNRFRVDGNRLELLQDDQVIARLQKR